MVVDPETKRKTIETLVKGGLAIVFFAATASYAWVALEGLIAWSLVGAGLLAWWVVAPGLAERAANWRIAALKAAVEANPIEAMQNLAISKDSELQAQSKAITEVDTQYRNVRSMVANLAKTDEHEAGEYQEIVDKILEGLSQMKEDYSYAKAELDKFQSQIAKAQRLWDVAVAINKAIAVSEKARADVFRDIKKKVAFDAVTTNLNLAFARLDTSVREHKQAALLGTPERKALPEAKVGEVIELGALSPSKQKATIRL